MKKQWRAAGMVLLCLGMAFMTSGCGRLRNRAARRAGGADSIDGVLAPDLYGHPLGERLEGEEYASQFAPVYFAYDSSQVGASERMKIETVADFLRSNRNAAVIIEGHCDERGSREYNLGLGERRALAVRAYLIGLGIDGARVQTKSFGKEQPVAFGHDESAWNLNRRCEFVLIY